MKNLGLVLIGIWFLLHCAFRLLNVTHWAVADGMAVLGGLGGVALLWAVYSEGRKKV